MRRFFLLAIAAIAPLVITLAAPAASYAQYGAGGPGGPGGRGGGDDDQQQQDDAARKKRDKEWSDNQAPLPQLRNAGPCPFVKSLYDAARYVEFKDGREASANVAYSGEIQGISAGCQYKSDEPINLQMELLFEFGKGPLADSSAKTYHYWVAVTERNLGVLAKQEFDIPVKFPEGKDRVYITEKIGKIIIPRATATTSGGNFEVLVGFDVTPEMAAFNRDGKRFRLNAGTAQK